MSFKKSFYTVFFFIKKEGFGAHFFEEIIATSADAMISHQHQSNITLRNSPFSNNLLTGAMWSCTFPVHQMVLNPCTLYDKWHTRLTLTVCSSKNDHLSNIPLRNNSFFPYITETDLPLLHLPWILNGFATWYII